MTLALAWAVRTARVDEAVALPLIGAAFVVRDAPFGAGSAADLPRDPPERISLQYRFPGHQPKHKENEEDYDGDEEQDLGDASRRRRDAGKSQESGDDRNNKEKNSPPNSTVS